MFIENLHDDKAIWTGFCTHSTASDRSRSFSLLLQLAMTIPRPPMKRSAPQAATNKKLRKTYSLLFKAQVVSFVQAQRDAHVRFPLVVALEKFKDTPEGASLSKQSISDWFKEKDAITRAATIASQAGTANEGRRKVRKVQNDTVETATVMWCKEKSKQGMLLTGLTIREKAGEFQQKLGGARIEYSEGWLYCFCKQ